MCGYMDTVNYFLIMDVIIVTTIKGRKEEKGQMLCIMMVMVSQLHPVSHTMCFGSLSMVMKCSLL